LARGDRLTRRRFPVSLVSIHKWPFFSLDCVLRGFPAAAYTKYASPQTLERPCPAKKILIYELDTQ
ncbi:MAG: hypothetical protein PVI69_08215, partial [Desulfobacterales bacterium]